MAAGPSHIITQSYSLTSQDKGSGASAGYGFVKFADQRCALLALQYLNVSSWCVAARWPS